MRRRPNWSVSMWLKENAEMSRAWVIEAECGWHQHLPWISDNRPDDECMREMREICQGCPVRGMCASFAVKSGNGSGVDGGFYAGYWIPWKYPSESDTARTSRAWARRRLKNLADLLVPA